MAELRDALLFLDLDRGVESAGPLFDEPRRRLEREPELRAAWSLFQALRALAFEAAPDPGERLIRQALADCRQDRVRRQLARTAGSEDLAREILLGRVKERRGLPAWAGLLLLAGALGLGWVSFGRQLRDWWAGAPMDPAASAPLPAPADGGQPLPFEFPAETPVDAALASPEGAAPDSEDVKHESDASREARRLVRQQLQARAAATRAEAEQDGREGGDVPAVSLGSGPVPVPDRPLPPPRPAPTEAPSAPPTAAPTATPLPTSTPLPTHTAMPTAPPTAVPTAVPTTVPTAAPTVPPTPAPTPVLLDEAAARAAFSLSGGEIRSGKRLLIYLELPEKRPVDLRLFDQRGKAVRGLWDGNLGPGKARLPFDAVDAAGKGLAPGTYYLRVMTHWFSRVEPVQVK